MNKTPSSLEVAAWVAGVIAAVVAILSFILSLLQEDRFNATFTQSDNKGTQIGSIEGNVIINSEQPPKVNSEQAPKLNTMVALAAFNLNEKKSYFTRSSNDFVPVDGPKRNTRTWTSTPEWAELATCVEENKVKNISPKKCGDPSFLSALFDVTLTADGDIPVILNELRAEVIYMQEAKGSTAGLNSANIPISAIYSIELPDSEFTENDEAQIKTIAAIPPLIITKDVPARFEVELVPSCMAECTYVLQLQFVLSSGQEINTGYFLIDWLGGN